MPRIDRFEIHDRLGYRLNATSYRHARNDAFCLWANYTAGMVP